MLDMTTARNLLIFANNGEPRDLAQLGSSQRTLRDSFEKGKTDLPNIRVRDLQSSSFQSRSTRCELVADGGPLLRHRKGQKRFLKKWNTDPK